MSGIAGTRNTWAPEIYWDAAKSQWLVIWSSTIEGRHEGHRIYGSRTSDFRKFTDPAIFFDPGYNVIDATILQTRGRYFLVFKDERAEPVHKALRIADGPTLSGPWSNLSDEFTVAWSEGPSILQLGNDYVVYYDHYREPKRYEAVRSSDLKTWINITAEIRMPEASKHGSFLKITREERDRLRAALNRAP
jgi:hypothetical protein